MYEVSAPSGSQIATFEKKLDMLMKVMTTSKIVVRVEECDICSHTDHTSENCPMTASTE